MGIKGVCGGLCVLLILVRGWNWNTVIYCFMTIVLVFISVTDYKTYRIPPSLNFILLGCGIVHGILNPFQWTNWLTGAFIVSLPLAIAFYLTDGKAVGGGDVKLMAVCGLLLGWRNILNGFFMGCIFCVLLHGLCKKRDKRTEVVAMGPYLAAGIYCAVLFENLRK